MVLPTYETQGLWHVAGNQQRRVLKSHSDRDVFQSMGPKWNIHYVEVNASCCLGRMLRAGIENKD